MCTNSLLFLGFIIFSYLSFLEQIPLPVLTLKLMFRAVDLIPSLQVFHDDHRKGIYTVKGPISLGMVHSYTSYLDKQGH